MLQSIANQFNNGGPFMWVILCVFGIGVAVMIERIIYYYIVCRGDCRKITLQIRRALSSGCPDDARRVLGKRGAPLYAVLRSAIDRFAAGASQESIEKAVEESALCELPKMSLRLNYLALLANIATLLGLLGTISGLQVSFSSLASVDAAQKASMLANGIAQAMNTTAFGLIVAVPCMVMYTILNNKQQSLTKGIDEAVVKVINSMNVKAV